MADLFMDYLRGVEMLQPFFAHGARAVLGALLADAGADASLVDAVNRMQEQLGGDARWDARAATIVTGQQPGLLTGPLYTIYKAATAIRLAADVTAKTGRVCTPIFWVAGDDHDFEEARTTYVLTKQHELRALTYTPNANVDASAMYRVPVEPSLHDLIDLAASQTQGSEMRGEIAAFLHESLDASASLSEWFARIIARLFRGTPLVVFPSELSEARRVATRIAAQELHEPLASTRLVNEAGARLATLGYDAQVIKAEDGCNLFMEIDGRRRKLVHRDGIYIQPDTDARFTREELLARLEKAPQDFSPNVVLRGVVQQAVFPNTAAYIGGPGEIAYWAQLKAVFAHFGQPMPVVYPRARAVLTTLKLNKLREKLGLSYDALLGPPDDVLDAALRRAVRSPSLDAFERNRGTLEQSLSEFVDRIAPNTERESAARAQAETFATTVRSGLDKLGRALSRGDAAQVEAVREQVRRLCTALAPERKPQERILNVFSFLFEHGWDLIPRITAELDHASDEVQEIVL